uniref:Titin n=1 Tax=Monopterus albus TaxID=43700 RepID=A0A3Q3JJJ9_MONAL
MERRTIIRDLVSYVTCLLLQSFISFITEPPYFIEDLEPMECRIAGSSPIEVSWMKDGEPLRPGREFSMLYDDNTAVLQISRGEMRHSGEYTCMATNSVGSASCRAKLTLQEAKKPPVFDVPLKSVTVDEGEKLSLRCHVCGSPPLKIQWMKDRKELTSAGSTRITFSDGMACLETSPASRHDAGDYLCKATNNAGSELLTVLNVTGGVEVPPTIEVDVKLIEGIIVKAGTTIRLPAIIKGIPVPTAKWSIEGEEITSQGKVKIDTDNFSTVLSINECTRSHTGTYLLTASNPAGTKTVALNVTVTPESMMIEWLPPKDDGGSPVTNYIVEKRESNKESWGGVSSSCLTTQLRITRLQKGVEYVVRIRAENKMGIGAPLESKPTVAEHSFTPPSPPGKPQTSGISEDAVTVAWTIPLSDGGSPIIGYIIERRHKGGKWIRVNKIPCRDLRYRVLGLFEGSEYEFRVFAENIAGYSGPSPISDPCKPCRPITVPSPPVNPKVKDYSKTTADLVWTKPTKDGGSPILGYTVEMKKADTEEWKKVNLDEFIKPCAYRVTGLKEGMTYRFRVCASNMIGDGEPREIPESITAQDILIPPEIELEATCRDHVTVRVGNNINIIGYIKIDLDASLRKGLTVRAGCPIRLFAVIRGRPAPSVTWRRMGVDLVRRGHVDQVDTMSFLVIPESTREDSGRYSLTLSNSAGEKAVYVHVKVLGEKENNSDTFFIALTFHQ